MPELPEVEATARGLRPRVVGRAVVAVGGVDWPRMLPNTSADELRATLVGQTLTAVDRLGKYLLARFDHDLWLAFHRKMSGNLLVQPAESPAPLHTHFEMVLDDGHAVRFVDPRKFGRVYLFRSAAERDDFLGRRLGPDSLLELTPDSLLARLRGRTGRIKSLLLDQAFIAGVGNLYADEALWLARIHPLRAADSLSRPEVRRLAEAITDVLRAAIERRGTSFSASYRDADGEPGENQAFLNAYGRENEPCPRCGRPIRRIQIAQRSAHLCAHCQPVRPRRAPRKPA